MAFEDLLNTRRMLSSLLTFVSTCVWGEEKHKEEACLNWSGLFVFTKIGLMLSHLYKLCLYYFLNNNNNSKHL